jgi:cold shock CspA family protein
MEPKPIYGEVITVKKNGYGFILYIDENNLPKNIFYNVNDCVGKSSLKEGDKVTFLICDDENRSTKKRKAVYVKKDKN